MIEAYILSVAIASSTTIIQLVIVPGFHVTTHVTIENSKSKKEWERWEEIMPIAACKESDVPHEIRSKVTDLTSVDTWEFINGEDGILFTQPEKQRTSPIVRMWMIMTIWRWYDIGFASYIRILLFTLSFISSCVQNPSNSIWSNFIWIIGVSSGPMERPSPRSATALYRLITPYK